MADVVVEEGNVQVRGTRCRNEGSNSTTNVVRLSEVDTGRAGPGRFLLAVVAVIGWATEGETRGVMVEATPGTELTIDRLHSAFHSASVLSLAHCAQAFAYRPCPCRLRLRTPNQLLLPAGSAAAQPGLCRGGC
jgi:hypothetical protein